MRLAGALLALGMTALFAASERRVNDGHPHGDPPYLLEGGWTVLLNCRDLEGRTYEKPDKADWTAAPGAILSGRVMVWYP
jgi:hypothetical protein